jgi:hypothetical protein
MDSGFTTRPVNVNSETGLTACILGACLIGGSGYISSQESKIQENYANTSRLEKKAGIKEEKTENDIYKNAYSWLTENLQPGYFPCGGVHPNSIWACMAGTFLFISPGLYSLYKFVKKE